MFGPHVVVGRAGDGIEIATGRTVYLGHVVQGEAGGVGVDDLYRIDRTHARHHFGIPEHAAKDVADFLATLRNAAEAPNVLVIFRVVIE